MKARRAAVVSSVEQLIEELRGFVARAAVSTAGRDGETTATTVGGTATISEELLAQSEQTSATLGVLCESWLDGAAVPWERLHAGRSPRIISLPTYPFMRRSCWSRRWAEHKAPADSMTPGAPADLDDVPSGNKVVDLYSYLARNKTAAYQMEYLTFFPFVKKIPGFSMTRVALNPEKPLRSRIPSTTQSSSSTPRISRRWCAPRGGPTRTIPSPCRSGG
jgi:polyketide synthase PksM